MAKKNTLKVVRLEGGGLDVVDAEAKVEKVNKTIVFEVDVLKNLMLMAERFDMNMSETVNFVIDEFYKDYALGQALKEEKQKQEDPEVEK